LDLLFSNGGNLGYLGKSLGFQSLLRLFVVGKQVPVWAEKKIVITYP
jgi:hypothetical protein